MTQPDPKPGKEDVWPHLYEDMMDRVRIGKEAYGTCLQTHNGRDPLEDLADELWDALFYIKQFQLERDSE